MCLRENLEVRDGVRRFEDQDPAGRRGNRVPDSEVPIHVRREVLSGVSLDILQGQRDLHLLPTLLSGGGLSLQSGPRRGQTGHRPYQQGYLSVGLHRQVGQHSVKYSLSYTLDA